MLAVRLTPRAGRDAIDGLDPDGTLRVRVAAAPADGAANRVLLRLLADSLDVPLSGLSIVSGESSRHKRLHVAGLDEAELRARLSVRSSRSGGRPPAGGGHAVHGRPDRGGYDPVSTGAIGSG